MDNRNKAWEGFSYSDKSNFSALRFELMKMNVISNRMRSVMSYVKLREPYKKVITPAVLKERGSLELAW
jgi:hypothetical protein